MIVRVLPSVRDFAHESEDELILMGVLMLSTEKCSDSELGHVSALEQAVKSKSSTNVLIFKLHKPLKAINRLAIQSTFYNDAVDIWKMIFNLPAIRNDD